MVSVSPTNQDLSNDTTFSQIKSRVPVPLKVGSGSAAKNLILICKLRHPWDTNRTISYKDWSVYRVPWSHLGKGFCLCRPFHGRCSYSHPLFVGPELSLKTTLVFLLRVLLFSHATASCVKIFKLVRPSEGYFQCFYLLGTVLWYR